MLEELEEVQKYFLNQSNYLFLEEILKIYSTNIQSERDYF